MRSKLLAFVAWLAALTGAALVFGVAAYLGFSLFVRSGVTQVPEVVGTPREEAEAVLGDSGLVVRWAAEQGRYDDAVPAGHVLRQQPRAAGLVKRGSTVELLQSLGPQLVEVPDVRGRALAAAQVILAAAGLSPGRTANVHAVSGAPGTVVEQWPTAGERVGHDDPVDLYLALDNVAEVFVMPDLVYKDYETIQRFFELSDFRLGSVKFEPYDNVAPGIVLRQFPLAGHPLARRDVISLVVSRGAREG